MTEAGDLWLFAIDLFEDPVKREIFINMRSDNSRVNMNSEISKKLHKRHCFNLLLGSCYTNDLAATYYYKYIYKEPCMTSSLTGEAWVMEVLNGHPIRCVNAIIGRDKGFQGLARDIIRPKDPTFQLIPPQIMNDKRYMPYFKNCIGCIDGTHIRACITESQQLPYIGRKGVPTFNVMATCDFDMCFTYVSVGWEGSAHDTRVFMHSIQNKSMNFPQPPEGKYYLVDKGYPDRKGYLVPYPKTRYHQSQFQKESPNNMQEAFNRSHSSLRSYIERSFGILKKRFRILREMPRFSVQTQIDVITATFALHNYIRTNSQEDILFAIIDQHPNYIPRDELIDVSNRDRSAEGLFEGRSNEMKHVRNDIATLIWNARRK
ncbi:uncharacterized protein [Rutidosis leptorrhynchoides]|uniref:uncharacterized protein n=1 Tax=Rutidosis leptorrhynchoides TaxID=125765 RepID=UPI003A9A5DE8